jgi:hypothetical protein
VKIRLLPSNAPCLKIHLDKQEKAYKLGQYLMILMMYMANGNIFPWQLDSAVLLAM